MRGRDFYTGKSDLSFPEIVFSHFKRILEISSEEFRGGYYNSTYQNGISSQTYVPDTRSRYSQSVESLSSCLFPYFDKEMAKYYQKYIEKTKEIKEKYADKEGRLLFDEDDEEGKKKATAYSIERLELSKELFLELSKLLHRKDYLKGRSFSEGDPDVVDYEE